MVVKCVLDTNIVLYLFAGRLPAFEGLQQFISVVTELELLSYRDLEAGEERRIRAFLADIPVIDLTPEIKQATISIRRQHRLKLADAIIVATAIVLDAGLITNDAQLLRAGLPLPFVEAPQLRP